MWTKIGFLDHLPLLLVHVVIEWHLVAGKVFERRENSNCELVRQSFGQLFWSYKWDKNNLRDFAAFNNKATVSEQNTESKKCCEKRHCHCDEKQSKEKKKMSLKDLRSPSMEYALELGKQILKSPLSSPKVACIWVRI